MPSTVTSIGGNEFSGCTAMKSFVIRAIAPPSLGVNSFSGNPCSIYVPDQSVEAYKTASNWSTYASKIKPLSEYVES